VSPDCVFWGSLPVLPEFFERFLIRDSPLFPLDSFKPSVGVSLGGVRLVP